MGVNFSFGGQPVEVMISGLQNATKVTAADMLFALNNQKSRILKRTESGVDVNGQSFHAYSEKGPYYYYPNKGGKGRKAAAARFKKQVGRGNGRRTPLGVKFKSYGDFKRSLGRGVVDLLGVSAPHMLQAIVVRSGASGGNAAGTIGIYGPEADRAEGHNVGTRTLPKREFFGISISDETLVTRDIQSMLDQRIDRLLQ